MQILNKLYDNKEIKHILVRHEQGAVHAACGYARIANKLGIVLVTSGPGATNTVTGLADAYYNHIPLIAITGQVSSHLLGTDAFQEADIISITAPVTKWNYQIRKASQIAEAMEKAFHIAISEPAGPVLLDITKDAQTDIAVYNATSHPISYARLHTGCIEQFPVAFSSENVVYREVMQILGSREKDLLAITDFAAKEGYSGGYLSTTGMFQSALFHVPGYGLPAAIGTAFANTGRTICLVAGTAEFQTTIKELGVIKQEGLNIKMILLNSYHHTETLSKNPDFVRLASAYGIKGRKISVSTKACTCMGVKEKKDLCRIVDEMLSVPSSYLLQIDCGVI